MALKEINIIGIKILLTIHTIYISDYKDNREPIIFKISIQKDELCHHHACFEEHIGYRCHETKTVLQIKAWVLLNSCDNK